METVKSAISYDDFYKLDLRVARIVWAGLVDGAERMLKLTLDVGLLGQRIVVCPLRPWYDPKKLLGRRVIYLANMKRKRVGELWSAGTVLVASPYNSKTNEYDLTLVVPDKTVPVGSTVR